MRTHAPLAAVVFFSLSVVGCREPMANDPGYRAQVTCTQKMKARAEAGGGTRNDSKALCIGWVGDRYRADPSSNQDAFADCVLAAADEKAAELCKSSVKPTGSAGSR